MVRMDNIRQDDSEAGIGRNGKYEINSSSRSKVTNTSSKADVKISVDDMEDVTRVEESCTNPVPNKNEETSGAKTCPSTVNDESSNLCAKHETITNKDTVEDAGCVADVVISDNSAELDEHSEIIFLDSGETKYDTVAEAVNDMIVSDASELTCVTYLSTNDDLNSDVSTGVMGLHDSVSNYVTDTVNSRKYNQSNGSNLPVAQRRNSDISVNKNVVDLDSGNLNSNNNIDEQCSNGANSPRNSTVHNKTPSRSLDQEDYEDLNLAINTDRTPNQSLRERPVQCSTPHDSQPNEISENADPRPMIDSILNDGMPVTATSIHNHSNGHTNVGGSGNSLTNGRAPPVEAPSSASYARNASPNTLNRQNRRNWCFIKYWAMRDKVVMLLQSLVGLSTDRQEWNRPFDSNISLASYTVGLSNILRFPYLMIKHGGANFLISYGISLLVIGFPLYMVDISLAQYLSLEPTNVYSHLAPMFSGLGWAMIATAFFVSIYYSVVLSWILVYFYQSLRDPLPWEPSANKINECGSEPCHGNDPFEVPKNFFHSDLLDKPDTEEPSHLSSQLVVCLGLAWLLVVLSVIRRRHGNASYVTIVIPYVVLLVLLLYRCVFDSKERCHAGFQSFLYPNQNQMSPDLENTGVWIDAASQMLFSLGHALGGHGTLASYNSFHQSTLWSSVIVVLWDTGTSILCTCIVYSAMCYPIQDCYPSPLTGDVAFITYSFLVMKIGSAWSVLFFLVLFILGISSLVGFVETITTALFTKIGCLRSRYFSFICTSCFLLFLLGLPMCSFKGIHQVELMHMYTCKVSIIVLGLLQVILVGYIFGFRKFMKLVREDMKISIPVVVEWYLAISLKLLVPVAFAVLLLLTLLYDEYISTKDKEYSETQLGLILPITSCLFVPGFAVYELYKNRGTNWQELLKPSAQFRPANQRRQEGTSFVLNDGSEYSMSSSVHAAGGFNPYITISSITEMFRWSRNWSVDNNGTALDRTAPPAPAALQLSRISDDGS
ncbi:sodium- and chloride-dependent GABA transporter 1-like [Palaemon carinicauda]|uniref:sodium- and chloride-dependent GABA transporter 1-like n=1 Tax=Palaemon carinicauda TaxID=392227 RepID=UPI0035B5E869